MEQNNIYQLVFKVTHAGGSGSCFYLKDYDLFVTNYHVVKGFHAVAVHDNDRNPYLAKVVLVNPSLDIALLFVDGDFSALPSLNLAGDNSLSIGGKVCVAGYPYGMPFTVTEGSVSSPKQLVDGKYYIQTDAAVNPGNSGGPIFNEKNEVVGVTVSKLSNADNMGFGIRVEALRKLLEFVEAVDRTAFQVQCDSCDELISEEEEFCPSCGEKLPEGIFEEREPSSLSTFCERVIRFLRVTVMTPGHSIKAVPKCVSLFMKILICLLFLLSICCQRKRWKGCSIIFWVKISVLTNWVLKDARST